MEKEKKINNKENKNKKIKILSISLIFLILIAIIAYYHGGKIYKNPNSQDSSENLKNI